MQDKKEQSAAGHQEQPLPETKSGNPIIILGIGRTACRILERQKAETGCRHLCLRSLPRPGFIKTHESAHARFVRETKETFHLLDTQEAVPLPDSILHPLKEAKEVILFTALGGHTGSVCLPAIARFLKQHQIKHTCVFSLPYAFEGKTICRIAAAARAKLPESLSGKVIDLEEHHKARPNVTAASAFRIADTLMTAALQERIYAIQKSLNN